MAVSSLPAFKSFRAFSSDTRMVAMPTGTRVRGSIRVQKAESQHPFEMELHAGVALTKRVPTILGLSSMTNTLRKRAAGSSCMPTT